MSDYVYESGLSTKRRRQRRTAVTLLLTMLFLFGAFWWAWSYIRDGGEDPVAAPTTTSTCSYADPRTVSVNVYNSTNRAGLAGAAAATLQEQGFQVEDVANDPLNKDLPGFVEVRFGPDGQAYAEAYKQYFQERVSLTADGREGTGLDIVLGDGFSTFDPTPGEPPAC